jgi:hypothetical protein
MPKTVQQVHIRFPREVHEAIKKVAKSRGTEINDFIKDAVAAALSKCPTCGHDHPEPRSSETRRRTADAAA